MTREQFAAKTGERFARMDWDNNGVIDRGEMPGSAVRARACVRMVMSGRTSDRDLTTDAGRARVLVRVLRRVSPSASKPALRAKAVAVGNVRDRREFG